MDLRTVKDLPRVLERHLERTQLRVIGVSVVIVRRDIQDPFLRERRKKDDCPNETDRRSVERGED